MGYDYDCPECGGPAYGQYDTTPCSACDGGYPSYINCSCGSNISTVRYGHKICANNCSNYACGFCDVCLDCHKRQTEEGYDIILEKYSKLKDQNRKLKKY